MTVRTFSPNYNNGRGVSYTCSQLCGCMKSGQLDVDMLVLASDPRARSNFIWDAIPPLLRRIVFKVDRKGKMAKRVAEALFLRSLRSGDVAYIWPGASVALYKKIKSKKKVIVKEMINGPTATAKKLLDDAYRRLGWPVGHGITEEMIREENEQLAVTDFVFAPNRFVRSALLENGVPAAKILLTSYGWEPQRMAGTHTGLPPCEGVTFIFTGSLCVRKGVPMLLDYWSEANIKGRLVLVGERTEVMKERLASYFERPDIVHVNYTDDIAALYRAADVFVFPSIEEGGPLVIHEAMALGLPVIVSPMGSGGVVQHNENGLVLDPYDRNHWIEALRTLAQDAELRRRLGEAAAKSAKEFTWDKVGERRRQQLLDRV